MLSLSPLLRGELEVRESGLLEVEAFGGAGAGAAEPPLAQPAAFQVVASRVGEDQFWLAGWVEGSLRDACARCLREVLVEVRGELGLMLEFRPGVDLPFLDEEREGADWLVLGNPKLGLAPLLSEVLLLNRPLTVLHDPSCKGLCPVCGTDLNERDCGHGARVLGPDHPSLLRTQLADLLGETDSRA